MQMDRQTNGLIDRSDGAKSRFLQFCDNLAYYVNCISSINNSYHHHQHVAIAQDTLVHLHIQLYIRLFVVHSVYQMSPGLDADQSLSQVASTTRKV